MKSLFTKVVVGATAVISLLCLTVLTGPLMAGKSDAGLRFEIIFREEKSKAPLDGRMLLLLSADGPAEPRFQISDGPNSQLVFGLDVDGLKPGEPAVFDKSIFGYPLQSLADVPAGEYWVQALLNRYETFHLASGHTVKLPADKGEGQQWNRKPGNLLSRPEKIRLDPKKDEVFKIVLDQEIPPIPDPPETKYIKHVKIQSKLLTEFWGRPMYLGAHVLLPEGFEAHPEARYPLIINHGHFPYTFEGFREIPPAPDLKPDYSERFRISGYNRIIQEYAH
ncbi:MAG: hypothetical protein AB1715_09485, partial [Acidobacteriota bacterium]